MLQHFRNAFFFQRAGVFSGLTAFRTKAVCLGWCLPLYPLGPLYPTIHAVCGLGNFDFAEVLSLNRRTHEYYKHCREAVACTRLTTLALMILIGASGTLSVRARV